MADHQQHCIVALVDDDARVRESLKHLLYSAGIETIRSAQPKKRFAGQTRLGKLPGYRRPNDGIDGCELQRRVAAIFPALPVIFVTAHPDDQVRSQAVTEGAFAFLYKPVDGEEFLAMVDAAVKRSRDKAIGKLPGKTHPGGSGNVDC